MYNIVQTPHIPIAKSYSNVATNMVIHATQNNDIFLRNYANTVEI